MERNLTTDIQNYTDLVPHHHLPHWNNSYNSSYDGRRYNVSHFIEFKASVLIWRYVAPVILVVGTIGSILSLLVLCRKSLRLQTTMFYLAALAIADLMVLYAGLVRLWLEHAENIYIRLSSRAACKVHNFFVYMSLDLTVWILVAVSVDRCLYVSWPQLARKWCKLRNARITVSIITVLSALINVHFFWTYDLEMHDSQHIYANGNKKCYASTSARLTVSFVENIWPWIDFCIYCLFPFLFMATSNSIIIKQLLRTERNMASYANCALEGGQRNVTEQRQTIQVKTSAFTSPDRHSNASEEETDKDGKRKKVMSDTLQNGICKRGLGSSVNLPAVKVDYSSENEIQQTLSMEMCLSDGHESKSLTTSKSLKYVENSRTVFDECFTPNVTTIMSGNCQSLTASNKRTAMKREVNTKKPGKHALESHSVTFDFLHGNTMPSDVDANCESNLSVINRTSKEGCENESKQALESHFDCGEFGVINSQFESQPIELSESKLKFDSQFECGEPYTTQLQFESQQKDFAENRCKTESPIDSGRLHVGHSQLELQPIELAVLDELTAVVTREQLAAGFHQEHIDRNNLLPEGRANREEIRQPKSTEKRKVLTNKVHPLQQIDQAISTDIFSVSIRGIRHTDTCENVTVFWNSRDDLIVKESKSDCNAIKHKLYELSHAEADSFQLNSTTNRVLRADHIENPAIELNKSYYINGNTCIDVNKSHYISESIGKVKKSHYHNEKTGTSVNKLDCINECIGINTDRTSHYHDENKGTPIGNKPCFQNENFGIDRDKLPCDNGNIARMNSATAPAVNSALGQSKKSLSSSKNKWQNSSTASDTLISLPSRRNTSSVSKTLLAVTIVFWILNAPIVIFIIGQTYVTTAADDRGRAVVILAWTIVNILQYMNITLHFFLYCLTGPKFRQELKDMFKEFIAIMKRKASPLS